MRHPHGLRAAVGGAVAPAITFVASAKATGNASVTINKPTGTANNDLMIAFVFMDSGLNRTWTPPSGWTEVLDMNSPPNITVAYKIAGASEPANYTWSPSGTGGCAGTIVTYSNASYDKIGTVSTTMVGSVQTASGITLAASGSTLFAFFCNSNTGVTWSSPTSGLSSLVSNSTTYGSYVLYSQDNVGSGATGDKSATVSSTSGERGYVLVGIKPS